MKIEHLALEIWFLTTAKSTAKYWRRYTFLYHVCAQSSSTFMFEFHKERGMKSWVLNTEI